MDFHFRTRTLNRKSTKHFIHPYVSSPRGPLGIRSLTPVRSSLGYPRPLGPLGLDFAQHRQTLRPPLDGKGPKGPAAKPCVLSDCNKGSRGSSSTVQMARGEWLKGGPQVGCVKVYKWLPCSHTHQDPSRLDAHSGIIWLNS